MAQFKTVQEIVNQASAELGFTPIVDVLSTGNSVFTQFRYLLNAVGQELVSMNDWEQLQEEATVTTVVGTSEYNLPTDFDHMIDQTGWDRTNLKPLGGSLSPQTWQYLKGSSLLNGAIYVTFRVKKSMFAVLPDNPVPDALDIRYEYIRNTWVLNSDGVTYQTEVVTKDDTILYPPSLVVKFLKVKYLEAKGFDSEKARDDFAGIFDSTSGQNIPSGILNAGGGSEQFPYIDPFNNVPDTGYG
jgi:hypothetical protein